MRPCRKNIVFSMVFCSCSHTSVSLCGTTKKTPIGVFFAWRRRMRGAHTFYKAIAHALILREGGTRKGSPFANNPVGIICKSGGTHTFAQSESPSPDFTRRGNPDGSPCTHSPPSGGPACGAFLRPKPQNELKTSIQLNFFEPVRYNDIKQAL